MSLGRDDHPQAAVVAHDIADVGLGDDLERQVVGEVLALVAQDLDADAEGVALGLDVTQLQELRAGDSVTVITMSSSGAPAANGDAMSSPVLLIEVTLPSSHGDRPCRGDPVRGVGAGRARRGQHR